ncbi:Hypothetical predicted protein [Mytilus galloprovincialis]|nr:Hypothetical predicted protein [Mytilus galloprovincialis]
MNKLKGLECKIVKSSTVLTTYDNSEIRPLGKTTLKLVNAKNGKSYAETFIVVKENTTPILGNQTIQHMNLVTINYDNIQALDINEISLSEKSVFRQYKDVFDGTGCLPGTYRLEIDETVRPVVHPPRKIPVALRDKLKTELERLTDKEMITPVTEPTPWVNNLVIVEKTEQVENLP